MNSTLSLWMKLAITAVVITALLYGKLAPLMGDIADDVARYVEQN